MFQKEAFGQKKHLRRPKDERLSLYADGGSGRSRRDVEGLQPTAHKPFGMAKKEKEFFIDSKEQQVFIYVGSIE